MERTVYEDLLEWKSRDGRKPLLLEGVRQCGKTYILKEFGKRNYDDVAYFTFENDPGLCDIFRTDLDPKRIVDQLGLVRAKKIEPNKTLIILDEIQFCNRAITSLKFFSENAPEYHIVCAGSLLGVMLSKPYSFPVGKVERLKMHPMSFREFIMANSEEVLIDHIDNDGELSEPIISKLKMYLDYYFIVGGMPAAVSSWIARSDINEVEKILDGIIEDYKADLSKHASESLSKLTLIWNSIPVQLARENRKFFFGHVKTGARSKDLEDALEWLVNAGLIHRIRRIGIPKVPLSMFADNTDFKIYLADIGILRRMTRIPPDFIFSKDKEYDLFRGAVTENHVLNEMIAYLHDVPYYWRSGGTAEVDFVAQIRGTIVPIEAKAGNHRSKSLAEFIGKHHSKIAVTTSGRTVRDGITMHVPLYALWKIDTCVRGKIRNV